MINKLLLFLVAGVLVAGSCGKKNKIPADILPPEKMEIVLRDMMRADQFLSDFVLNRDTSKKKEPESFSMYSNICHS